MTGFETKWCPADWLDELVPCTVKDPSELVHQTDGGKWILIDDIANIDEGDGCRMDLTQGQIVSFCAHRHYGSYLLTVHEDRTYSLDSPIPADATHFAPADCDWLQMHDTLEGLIAEGDPKLWSCFTSAPLPVDQHEITAWFWSKEIPFRFDIEGGKPTLTRCAGLS